MSLISGLNKTERQVSGKTPEICRSESHIFNGCQNPQGRY